MQRLSRRDLTALFILMIAAAAIFGLPLDNLIFNHRGTDYVGHLRFTEEMLSGNILLIHLIFHIATALVHLVPFFTLQTSAWLVVVLFTGATACVLYLWLRSAASSWGVALGIALALLVVAPISIFRLSDRGLYFGYVGINVVHNPTMAPLKCFSLLALIYLLRSLEGTLSYSLRIVLIGALLITLSMFSKPNFALVLLPALMIVLAYRSVLQRNYTGFRLVVFGLIVPMIVVLAFQYVAQYILIPNPSESHIIFAPLATLQYYEGSRLVLAVKFLLSIAFPLAITLLYRKAAFADLKLMLCWLMLVVGAAQMYLFAESGRRLYDGNFWWSAQIALFLLFASAARFWLARLKNEPRAYVSAAIFGLHLLAGIILLVNMTITQVEGAVW